jgi:hypothetical protein
MVDGALAAVGSCLLKNIEGLLELDRLKGEAEERISSQNCNGIPVGVTLRSMCLPNYEGTLWTKLFTFIQNLFDFGIQHHCSPLVLLGLLPFFISISHIHSHNSKPTLTCLIFQCIYCPSSYSTVNGMYYFITDLALTSEILAAHELTKNSKQRRGAKLFK